jgi:hypothetical protein
MKAKTARWIAPASISILLGVGVFLASYHARSQTRPEFTSYLAQTVTGRFRSDGTEGRVLNETWMRRSDGSTIRIFGSTTPDGETVQVTEITDIRGSKSMIVLPFLDSVMTFYMNPAQVKAHLGSQSADCVSRFADAPQATRPLFGVQAVEVREDRRGLRAVTWMAPELGCLVLQETAWHPSGSRNETNVVKLILEAPSEAVFEPPDGCLERSPESVETLFRVKYPGHFLYDGASLDRMQTRYYESRRAAN